MALEMIDSRAMKFTNKGQTAQKIIRASWTEVNMWPSGVEIINTGIIPPVIGLIWSEDRPDLICNDITIRAIPNNDIYAMVVCNFSTQGLEFRLARPNQASSWDETLEIYTEETSLDVYTDVKGDSQNDTINFVWEAKWASTNFTAWAEGVKNVDDTVSHIGRAWLCVVQTEATGDAPSLESEKWELMPPPILTIENSRTVFNIALYGDNYLVNRINDFTNKVNNAVFLGPWSEKKEQVSEDQTTDTPSNLDDVDLWKFGGATMDRVNKNTQRYNMRFVYKVDGWSNDYGVATNKYTTEDLNALFDGMDNIEPDNDAGLRA